MLNINNEIKNHWESIYSGKSSEEFSWTQEIPDTSLKFIHKAHLSKLSNIIDIGGGDSKLVDYLIEEGFKNITVLDISANALCRAKKCLGKKAGNVNWIVSDVTNFRSDISFDFWHDRAAFHFLTTKQQISKYILTAKKAVKINGFVTIGTFSKEGPVKCSGLDVKQYSEETLTEELKRGFEKIKCINEEHTTPFNTKQNFLFCFFKKNSI